MRPYPITKNPHCDAHLWKPQEDLLQDEEMRDPNWYPKNTQFNVYNRKDFVRPETGKTGREHSGF